MDNNIEQFLQSPAFGVVGASSHKEKYGNKVLRCLIQNNKKTYPVNPNEQDVEGIECLKSVEELPDNVTSISIITPPQITEKIVDEAIHKGIKNIWMQPGAESEAAIQKCREANINIIASGPC